MKPQYEHDCDECVFVGNYWHRGIDYDLYAHPDKYKPGELACVVVRYGDDGPEYLSVECELLDRMDPMAPLPMAQRRAMEIGVNRGAYYVARNK